MKLNWLNAVIQVYLNINTERSDEKYSSDYLAVTT